uniref:RBR-type E3 ubiquitin transferase n=1 Tax=Panagrolaimus superbus TaxID=310955 RepID=A0A914YZ64_9BILA
MSIKGGRKNLGTVVELAETGEDTITSPLLTNLTTINSTENKSENSDHVVIEIPSEDTEEDGTYRVPEAETRTSRYPKDIEQLYEQRYGHSYHAEVQHRRRSILTQSRLNLLGFINNVTTPIRGTRGKRSSLNGSSLSASRASHQSVLSTATLSTNPGKSETVLDEIETTALNEELDWNMSPSDSDTTAHRNITSDSAMAYELPCKKTRDCPLCYCAQPLTSFPKLTNCSHRSCRSCLARYLQIEIMESRINISCPECSEALHQLDIYNILQKQGYLIDKYENFALRRVLMGDPDTRWCPAPDCTYAVIATSCAACPQLKCERPGCNTLFCYHCKGIWHNNQTCDEARRERAPRISAVDGLPTGSGFDRDSFLKPGDVKACPRCRTLIVKMNDGSCNHMVCAMCGAEFCWLCLKVITDLHYLSPTGCTFWGKRPWTKKKKLLWQIGTLIGAPVGIALIAGLAVPGIIFGVPVFVGRKAYQRFAYLSKSRRRLITAASVVGSLIVSPVLAVLTLGVGIPVAIAYVYGVVPLSLCRNGGCGGGESISETPYGEEEDEIAQLTGHYTDRSVEERIRLINALSGDNPDEQSLAAGISVNSGISSEIVQPSSSVQPTTSNSKVNNRKRRQSVESGINSLGEKVNFDGASVNAMAGSRYDNKSVYTVYSDGQEAVYDEAGSTKGLAGSVMDSKSLTDSACGRNAAGAALLIRDREMSPTSMEDGPSKIHGGEDSVSCGSKGRFLLLDTRNKAKRVSVSQNVGPEDLIPAEYYCGGDGPSSFTRQSASSDAEEYDPYKVHAIMDNLKQMLNDDVVDEGAPVKKITKNFKKNPKMQAARSVSGKSFSGTAVSAQIAEEGGKVIITPSVATKSKLSTTMTKKEDTPSESTSSTTSSSLPRLSPSSSDESRPKRSFFSRIFRKKP